MAPEYHGNRFLPLMQARLAGAAAKRWPMLSSMSLTPQALKRRAKNYWRRNEVQLFVPSLPGFENITSDELAAFGENVRSERGGVSLSGDLSTIYRANLSLRTGARVLLRLSHFLSQNYPMLYDHARSVDWAAVLGNCPSVAIRVTSKESRLSHRNRLQKVIHDAICARLEAHSIVPQLSQDGGLTIHARLFQDRCTLSLDTTGVHLHKRGYRTFTTPAPMRETTAAALLLSVNADRYDVIVDPFCGTGTFLIEASLMTRNYPPGADREFAIEQSPLHAPGTLRFTRGQLLGNVSRTTRQRLVGYDIAEDAINAARRNASQAHIDGLVLYNGSALEVDFSNFASTNTRRLVVANVPYGKRLGTVDSAQRLLDNFCSGLGRTAAGWDYLITTPSHLAIRCPRMAEAREIRFSNGGVPAHAHFGRVH